MFLFQPRKQFEPVFAAKLIIAPLFPVNLTWKWLQSKAARTVGEHTNGDANLVSKQSKF